MAFLEFMGYTVEIADGEAVESQIEFGDTHRSFNGTLLQTRRAIKREWELLTAPYIQAEATAIRKLLQGYGHHWSFDVNMYSSKGLNEKSGTATTPSGGKFNDKLDVTADVQFATELTDDWTALLYRYDGADWVYYAVTSEGDEWEDGVKGSYDTSWMSVDGDGDLQLDISGANDYDDVVAFPFLAPDQMIEDFHGETVAFPDLPQLRIGGDIIPESTLTVACSVDDMLYRQLSIGGTLRDNAQQIRFRMREV
tara:strand:+ start:754 stop:1512 length:759 start_codon:yes stop_codon:yes gene_type:complete